MLRQEDFQEFQASLSFVSPLLSCQLIKAPPLQAPQESPLDHRLLKAVLASLVPTMNSGAGQHVWPMLGA